MSVIPQNLTRIRPDYGTQIANKTTPTRKTARGAGLPPGGGVLPSALRRGFFDLRGPGAQRHGRSLFLAITEVLDRHLVADFLLADEFDDLFHVGDLFAFGFGDHVASERDRLAPHRRL